MAGPVHPDHRSRPKATGYAPGLQLESAIDKLKKYDLHILDDLAYVTKDQAETSVLFELISARYEHRSILITSNQPFGECNRVSPDAAMTLAAGDRLEHHATIFEMNVEIYRRRTALEEKRQRGRPARLRRSGPQRCLSQSGNQKRRRTGQRQSA